MGRKLEFQPSEAVEKAMMVFWQRGYGRTSVDDLEAATGVGRKSLYRAFNDKHDLFIRALGSYRALMARENLAPLQEVSAGVAEICALFDKLVEIGRTPMGRMGCLLCNTAMELSQDDAEAARHVEGYLEQIRSAMRHALAQAVQRGELDLDDGAIAREANVLLGAIQSLCVLARAGAAPEVLTDVAEGALQRLR